jgi:uncharacterized protein YkwD
VDGACVLAEVPSAAYCSNVREVQSDPQRLEDELLGLVLRDRVAGGLDCPDTLPSDPVTGLSVDGSLICAARAKALDQAISGVTGPLDSEGRDAPERFELAGYASTLWWELHAYGVDTAAQAYEQMRQDADSCRALVDPSYTSIGVGVSGDVFVVALASQ